MIEHAVMERHSPVLDIGVWGSLPASQEQTCISQILVHYDSNKYNVLAGDTYANGAGAVISHITSDGQKSNCFHGAIAILLFLNQKMKSQRWQQPDSKDE